MDNQQIVNNAFHFRGQLAHHIAHKLFAGCEHDKYVHKNSFSQVMLFPVPCNEIQSFRRVC